MKRTFLVQNTSGETWPAFAVGQLSGLADQRHGVSDEYPVYRIRKPTASSGQMFVLNGGRSLAPNAVGTAMFLEDATMVRMADGSSASFGGTVGPVDGEWFCTSGGHLLTVLDAKSDRGLIPVVWAGAGNAGDTLTVPGCGCEAINRTDINVGGVGTTSKWRVYMRSDIIYAVRNGYFVVKAGSYIVEWDEGDEEWVLDLKQPPYLGNYLLAFLKDGTDISNNDVPGVTLTWLEAEFRLVYDNGEGFTQLTLKLNGTIQT